MTAVSIKQWRDTDLIGNHVNLLFKTCLSQEMCPVTFSLVRSIKAFHLTVADHLRD